MPPCTRIRPHPRLGVSAPVRVQLWVAVLKAGPPAPLVATSSGRQGLPRRIPRPSSCPPGGSMKLPCRQLAAISLQPWRPRTHRPWPRLLRALPDVVIVCDSSGQVLWGNTAAEHFFGSGLAESPRSGRTRPGASRGPGARVPLARHHLRQGDRLPGRSPLPLSLRVAPDGAHRERGPLAADRRPRPHPAATSPSGAVSTSPTTRTHGSARWFRTR